MSAATIAIPAMPQLDECRLAIAGFLARYSGPTRAAYTTDLRQYFTWCAAQDLDVFAARRGHLELWARSMEERGLARATVGRRLSTITGFYRFAVVDGLIPHSPAEFLRRPKISTESATLGLDRMELGAYPATPSGQPGRRPGEARRGHTALGTDRGRRPSVRCRARRNRARSAATK